MAAFARDTDPRETFAQDLYHLLITNKMSLLLDPDWGFGLETYLGRALPPTLAADIENVVRDDDRVSGASCTIVPVAGEIDSYRLTLNVECEAGFLELALALSPSGIVRVA